MTVIRQTVRFKAPAARLFDIYVTPKLHAAVTGAPVTVGRRAGSRFRAFEGMLSGKMLLVVSKRLIVQTWRSGKFRKSDPDSLLILAFTDTAGGGQIDLTHIGVPKHDLRGVQRGWPQHYWRPLKALLSR